MTHIYPVLLLPVFSLSCCAPSRPPLMQPLSDKQRQEISAPVPNAAPAQPAPAPAPEPIPTGMRKKVSLNCRELPMAELIRGLTAQTGTDLRYYGPASLRVSYNGQGQLHALLEDLCRRNKLRLKTEGKEVRVEEDTPYLEMYNVQFLNLSRSSQSRTSVSGSVYADRPGTVSSAAASGSQSDTERSEFNTRGNSDFWEEMRQNLEMFLPKESVTFHRQAGLIAVMGDSRSQLRVREYLEQLRRNASAQVLIEAKIIEVALNEEYKSGINWNALSNGTGLSFDAPITSILGSTAGVDRPGAGSDAITFGRTGNNFSGIINALERFGCVRTISSPRITALNNQWAVIKVAQNQVYFRLNYDKQFSSAVNRDSISVSSDIHTVPIGLVLSVQPAIDSQSGEVILFLRPSISKLSRSVADPAVDVATQQSTKEVRPSLIPVVEVREIESVLRLKDKEMAVVGGLMEVRRINEQAGLPGASDTPVFNKLLAGENVHESVVELVILLRVSIARDGCSVSPHPADTRLQAYVPDPRG